MDGVNVQPNNQNNESNLRLHYKEIYWPVYQFIFHFSVKLSRFTILASLKISNELLKYVQNILLHVCVQSHSVVSDSAVPWTTAYQAPLSMGFSRQEF